MEYLYIYICISFIKYFNFNYILFFASALLFNVLYFCYFIISSLRRSDFRHCLYVCWIWNSMCEFWILIFEYRNIKTIESTYAI